MLTTLQLKKKSSIWTRQEKADRNFKKQTNNNLSVLTEIY